MSGNEEKAYAYWFYNVPGMGGKKGRQLYEKMQSGKEIYEASEKKLLAYTDAKTAERIVRSRETWDILAEYESLKQQKIQITAYGLEDYPEKLLFLEDAPAVLYYKGRLPRKHTPSVAIIGARMCSEYGRKVAAWFGSKLGERGIQIISGMAMGIDGISQEAALHAGGESYGILGCGVDICYPQSNAGLYERLLLQGGIISEYAPGTMPKPQLFPPRNRIISGLADLVLVIEAKEKSGTFITVDMALEQGREVYVVPGRITDALSRGCLKLMKQGAGAALSPEDILDALYIVETDETGNKQSPLSHEMITEEENQENHFRKWNMTEAEKLLYSLLDENPRGLDDIHYDFKKRLIPPEKYGLEGNIRETMGLLIDLSIKGLAEQIEVGMFRKI